LPLGDAIEHAHDFLQGALRSGYSAGGAIVLDGGRISRSVTFA
jgi:hypothetical protein